MPKLVKNVIVEGVVYGPIAGNEADVPTDVAALIGAHAWDEAPAGAEYSVPSSTDPGPGDVVAAVPVPEGSDGVPVDGPGTPEPDPKAAAVADLLGDHASDEVPESEPTPLDELAAVPDDKTALLAFRDAHGLDDIDGRLGVEKLRAAITDALA